MVDQRFKKNDWWLEIAATSDIKNRGREDEVGAQGRAINYFKKWGGGGGQTEKEGEAHSPRVITRFMSAEFGVEKPRVEDNETYKYS